MLKIVQKFQCVQKWAVLTFLDPIVGPHITEKGLNRYLNILAHKTQPAFIFLTKLLYFPTKKKLLYLFVYLFIFCVSALDENLNQTDLKAKIYYIRITKSKGVFRSEFIKRAANSVNKTCTNFSSLRLCWFVLHFVIIHGKWLSNPAKIVLSEVCFPFDHID